MEKKRRKLFSEVSPARPTRRKLFSTPTITAKCHDCGWEIITAAEDGNVCPKCGGKRFDIIPTSVSDKNFSQTESPRTRRKLFGINAEESTADERMFSEGMGSEYENLLGQWQGKEMDQDYATRIFSGVDLIKEGHATETEEGRIRVFSMAEEMEKMFSSLKVTVIKELCLDPLPEPNPASVIDSLGASQGLPTKTIILLKKAHGLPKEVIANETEGWIKDSGIKQDLEHEFEGKDFGESKLKNILEERYDDAPEGLIEILKSSGVLETTPEGNLRLKK